ncbi:UDP-4-amino-4,6-dideoxy-N-acetyl-beta-L-altrosamine transaminase [Rhizobacter sp. Root404]|jgi:UDP-4-amino-4,6-dideoxy-N-acetyl-beta-L-altrosamine transaminase|uniref:UDP-4-amino-4, 6-dideoxy-N-acetyl-beta-L-altrosamine transaminase n=1 Tax=Rhizobacter sp. Root404 TaxID=1736528 RepID=UPI0006FF1B0A|nr:UDP-4-amino-4,6-dideoxy-N-acetyl-beta-L-altrosamine transaminase [Rhizobacter sp. Root404]KQW38237.1 UDP-4-amino-4,6-dideoxy-N-acetyl-beta-L-altrosamine transaminase [Rhizobacter sp. Root404]
MIPYGRQHISEADIEAVVDVLRSDFLTQGPAVPAFERAMCELTGATYGVAVNSATSALHIACMALGLGPGDRLWTVPITFLASANCARYCGADVDFVDIDPATRNIGIEALTKKLELAERQNSLPKILVPVHFTGRPCDMAQIRELSKRYGFFVIEDASHAVGSIYQGSPIGSGRYSDITVFSFHPVKIVTSAEGGMAMTNDAELAHRMELLRSHGMERDPSRFQDPAEGSWVYEMQSIGFNYRLTDLHATLGMSQLRRLEDFIARREALVARYDALLKSLPVTCPAPLADMRSAWHLYVVELETNHPRAAVFEAMRKAGVGVAVHYIPVHLQPYYRDLGFRAGDYPRSEHYYARALTLPLYPDLSDAQQETVVRALGEALA